MKYLNSTPFSVSMPSGQEYRDNWDATFGKKSSETEATNTADSEKPPRECGNAGCNECYGDSNSDCESLVRKLAKWAKEQT